MVSRNSAPRSPKTRELVDGRVHQTGFTTVFLPNFVVSPAHAAGYDIDWTNHRDGDGDADLRTYAAVTSRSHHPGSVNVVMMEGSVHTVTDDIDLELWRAASPARVTNCRKNSRNSLVDTG
jgi:hypothetical protein